MIGKQYTKLIPDKVEDAYYIIQSFPDAISLGDAYELIKN